MLLSRLVDEKAFNLQRQGRLGTYAPGQGQEAVATGVSMALRVESDWLVPQYRELAAQLRHGWSLRDAFLFFQGHPDGWRPPERVLPVAIALAAQLPHAVGLAWGLQQQGSDAVVATFCGDGASSEGDFHEALNFAGVLKAPVVFVVQDNNWAISTPRSRQSATTSFALRGDGYGMPGVAVDGNDLFAVYAAAEAAVARARAGDGPTLIEAKTYRLMAHNTADDATRYVDPDELASASAARAAAAAARVPRRRRVADRRGRGGHGRVDARRDRGCRRRCGGVAGTDARVGLRARLRERSRAAGAATREDAG